ncbi:uncharacterized protein LOC108865243 [Galendromus occidentalis]|uniref:Uncharacterized protein LOC108865243 n=1 Tax=Galendromus occidentalis TaxID=34638 RepID=A0AAJ7WJC9_9ACAR|nr:uncharacterized protein LOC108865243 [Galendromus occidentalis]
MSPNHLFLHIFSALGDNCASDEGPMCMANLQNLQAKDGGDVTKLSVAELVQRCADLRRNIVCLLTHTQRCVSFDERNQPAKVILEARKYLRAVCEADESVKAHWKDNKCYRQATLQRCDREFQELMQHKPPQYPPTENQCRNFHQYESCVQRTVTLCSDDSEEFVALYLLDNGARMAWLCPPSGDDQGHHQANALPGHLPWDPLMPPGAGGTQQGSSNGKNSGTTRKTMADIRRIPVIRDTHFVPPHKIEAALSGSSGSTCVKLIQGDMRRCRNRYQRQENELRKQHTRNKSTTVASDAQQVGDKKICCAFGTYIHCLQTAVQTRCSQDREALVDTVISQTSKLIGVHCEEYSYGSPKCSSGAASFSPATSTCLVFLLAVSLRYLAVRCALL